MRTINIMQIGAGGTGNWFARSAMHTLVQSVKEAQEEMSIKWGIQDPDNIEDRNLIRQPFYGGVNENKAEYVARLVNNFFGYSKVDANIVAYPTMLRESNDTPAVLKDILHSGIGVIVCCVDNSYTRDLIERTLMSNKKEGIVYLNMGVSEEGHWLVEAIRGDVVMSTPFGDLTYPDDMLSCAEREEMSPVPQTVYSNIQAGNMAAHMLMDIILTAEQKPVTRVYGKDYTCSPMDPASYFLERVTIDKKEGEKQDETANTDSPQ